MILCGFPVGLQHPFFLIAGPCVIESRQMAFDTAGKLHKITRELDIPFIYKSSFDKANPCSIASYQGPGMDEGVQVHAGIRHVHGGDVVTDGDEKDQTDGADAAVGVPEEP